MIVAVAALVGITAGWIYLYFGHYWHVLLNRKDDE